MSSANILINYSNPAARSSSNFVLLEQEVWDKNIGLLTKGGAVAYLNSLLFGDVAEDLETNCGVDSNGDANSTVYAYPSPSNLVHTVSITHGSLGDPVQEILDYAETVKVSGETDLNLKYPTSNVKSAEWVTKTYDRAMNSVALPALVISGGSVTTAGGAAGLALVTYEVIRFKFTVKVSQREKDTEQGWSSFIYTTWDGGNYVIKFNPPNDATLEGRNCANDGSQLRVEPDDPRNPPHAEPVDITKRKDYCTGCILRYVGFFVYNGVGVHEWECDPNEY